MKIGKKLSGGFTRNAFLCEIDGNIAVMKRYQNSFKYRFVDFSKSTFSIFFSIPRISFLSIKERIEREIRGHEKLKELGIAVPEILDFSVEDGFIVEEFVDGINLYNLINTKKEERESLSYEVGKLTGFLHSKGFAFLDNRPQNYILKDGKIFRVDLETFEFHPSQFEEYCDVISFVESFFGRIRNEVHKAFISGYECYSRYIQNRFIETLARRSLLFLNFNLPSFRISLLFHKNSISSYSYAFSTLKHLLARHLRKSKSN